jgi:glycosyltransferase involved in cell wall biosynthesis
MKYTKKIAIFIPTYNAARTLPIVLDRIPQELKENVGEIFIMDDASEDNTHLIGIGYKQQTGLSNLKIYRNEKNQGYGGNQKLAYQYTIDQGFDLVVMLHGDAQYAPEKIPTLLEPFETDEADMVFGSRIKGNPLKGGMPFYKYFGNRTLTAVENWVLGLNLSEYHSGFRVYSCRALQQIPFHKLSNNFHFDTEIIIQFKLKGLRIVERAIPTYYGNEKCYVNIFDYGFNILGTLFEYWLHKKGFKKSEKYSV